jgi:hypothetical protein
MKSALRPTLKPLVLALALVGAGPAHALQFSWDDVKINLDTTISYGVSSAPRAATRRSSASPQRVNGRRALALRERG